MPCKDWQNIKKTFCHDQQKLSLYQVQTESNRLSESSCWRCRVVVASNIYAFKSDPKGFRACESMQLRLVTNWRSLIKNQLIQSDSALNVADKKLSKNNDYLMRPYSQVIQTETSWTSCSIRLKQSTKFVGRSGCMNSCSPVFDKL